MTKEWITQDWTSGQLNAIVKALGEDNARALLAGTLTVERVEKVLQLKDRDKHDKVAMLFDKYGFRIKTAGFRSRTTKPNTACHFVVPNDPAAPRLDRLARIVKFLGGDPFITANEFETRVQAVLSRIGTDETTAKLLNGVALPFAIPQMKVGDYGKTLEEKFLPIVLMSYRDQFPKRPFKNFLAWEQLVNHRVTIVEGSRHEQLLEAMGNGVVVGVYFPNTLQGFSVHADREQMSSLPEHFLLAGGFETAMCYIAYPDVLARDGNVPVLDLAALQWQSEQYSLYFAARDDYACFGHRTRLYEDDACFAGGLVVLG
jgi:hypothetical protein